METDKRSLSLLTILPVCTFGIVGIISGLSYSGKMIAAHWNLPVSPLVIVDAISLILFVTLTLFFLYQFSRQPDLLRAAIKDPPSPHYFVVFPMTILFLSGIFWPYNHRMTITLWGVGALLVGIVIFKIAVQWICRPCLLKKMTAAYIMPITVALDVPVTGYYLHFSGVRMICNAFLVVGLAFSAAGTIQQIVSLFRHRQQMDVIGALITFSVLTALVYMAYDSYTDKESSLSVVLFYTAAALLIAITLHILYHMTDAAFAISIWTFSSPLIIVTVSAIKFALRGNNPTGWIIAASLFTVSTLAIVILLGKVTKQFIVLWREVRSRPITTHRQEFRQ